VRRVQAASCMALNGFWLENNAYSDLVAGFRAISAMSRVLTACLSGMNCLVRSTPMDWMDMLLVLQPMVMRWSRIAVLTMVAWSEFRKVNRFSDCSKPPCRVKRSPLCEVQRIQMLFGIRRSLRASITSSLWEWSSVREWVWHCVCRSGTTNMKIGWRERKVPVAILKHCSWDSQWSPSYRRASPQMWKK